MNDEQKTSFIAWLNDAHALEQGLITVLEKQVEDTKDHPVMQERIKEHLEETRRHATLVEECITRHGETPSGTKDTLSKAMAALNGIGMSIMSDAMVKNVHSSYAAEHMEIATYTLLRAAANEFGDTATVAVCDEILRDEERMAEWLIGQLPDVAIMHMETRGVSEA